MIYGKQISPDITIRIDHIPDSRRAAGVCNIKRKSIILATHHWNRKSKLMRWELVLHELGHCELGRNHVFYDEYRFWKQKRCEPSIMGRKGASEECFKKHYDYYINELFNGCKKLKLGRQKWIFKK